MTTTVFFLNRLRDGADAEEYERFVREVDYPTARGLDAIERYDVVRIDGPLRDDEVPYDYIEVVEVRDLESYRADLEQMPGREAFIAELRSHIGDVTALRGTLIE